MCVVILSGSGCVLWLFLSYICYLLRFLFFFFFFFQAEDGIRDLVRSRGLGDVYKRQMKTFATTQRNYREAPEHELKEGDILDSTWGYEQTLSLIHI